MKRWFNSRKKFDYPLFIQWDGCQSFYVVWGKYKIDEVDNYIYMIPSHYEPTWEATDNEVKLHKKWREQNPDSPNLPIERFACTLTGEDVSKFFKPLEVDNPAFKILMEEYLRIKSGVQQ